MSNSYLFLVPDQNFLGDNGAKYESLPNHGDEPPEGPVFLYFLRFIMKNAATRLAIPSTPRATAIPMPAFAPVLRPLLVELGVGETDPVLVGVPDVNPSADVVLVDVVEELVVEAGANTYPFTWTA